MVRSFATNGPGDGVAVIVTGGEYLSGLATVRALRAAGYAPWVAVHQKGSYAARSRAAAGVIEVPSPWDDDRGFVREIAAAAGRVRAAAILPGTEYDLLMLARHADKFPQDVAVGAPSLSTIVAATDKGTLGALSRAAGLSNPPTAELGLADIPSRLPFPLPVVVKPQRSELIGDDGLVHHHAARHAGTIDELRAAIAALPGKRGLIQPFIRAPLGSLAGAFWDGRLVCALQSRADRVWPAPCGSISHAETVRLDQGLTDSIGELLRSVGWHGIFQVDFLEEAGEHLIIDLNPRPYTSLGHATRAGLNLPSIWVDLLLGREPDIPATYRVGVHYRHEEGDVRALARMLLHGPRGQAVRGLVPHRGTAHAVFSWSDPGPILTSLSRLGRRKTRSRGDQRAQPVLRGKGRAPA